jgi:membrane protease YdiL (CAAX protease family)
MSLQTTLKRGYDALVHPQVRLEASTEFPLTGKTLGKAYIVGFVLFMVGSIAPMLLFFAVLFALAKFADPNVASVVFGHLFLANGEPQPFLLGSLMVSSFLGGFALEMSYLRRLMHQKGKRLRDVVGLSTKSMQGRNWLQTFWNIGWRAVLVFAFALGAEQLLSLFMHAPEQPTVDMARKLTGGSGWMFFVLAGVFAPILEEFCFRGILFQALRATFHKYRVEADATAGATQSERRSASPSGECTSGCPSKFGRALGRFVFTTASRADLGAVVVSALVFALWHLQFHPVHLIMLFAMGCLLAETFRRTGTLWTSIAVHALNNGLMALMIMYAT